MDDTLFVCAVHSRQGQKEAALFVRSLRLFGGSMANAPVRVLVPGLRTRVAAHFRDWMERQGAQIQLFDPCGLDARAALYSPAAAAAESAAAGQFGQVVWLTSDALVLRDPAELALPAGKAIGCRPVDITLIGSRWEREPDAYWAGLYRECGVQPERLFPMRTGVDGNALRPYFNLGLLVLRPELGLLQAWRENYIRLLRQGFFDEYFNRNELYRIFAQQTVLACTLLNRLAPDEFHILPQQVNYPLHLHQRMPAEACPPALNDLITARYDTFFDNPNWRQILPVREPLKSFLEETFQITS